MADREAIYKALYDAVVTGLPNTPAFKTKGRDLKDWESIPPEQQPAFFQNQVDEKPTQKKGQPSLVEAYVDLYIYAKAGTDKTISDYSPATVLNNAVQAIITSLRPPTCNDSQTLGGLVSHAWYTGVQYVEGLMEGQAVAVVKVNLLFTE